MGRNFLEFRDERKRVNDISDSNVPVDDEELLSPKETNHDKPKQKPVP
jgi:hypothetical protein